MSKFSNHLEHKIVNANAHQDLYGMINIVELDTIKSFLLQQIRQNKVSHNAYFKSASIIDVCGSDVINKCLSYLSIHELYHTRAICKTFQKINTSILSSNLIYENYKKYNHKIQSFQNWCNSGYNENKTKPKNIAMFYLSANYGCYSKTLSVSNLKGEDKVLVRTLKNMGYESVLTKTIASIKWDHHEYQSYDPNDPQHWHDYVESDDEYDGTYIVPADHGYDIECETWDEYCSPKEYADRNIGFKCGAASAKRAGKMTLSHQRGPSYERYRIEDHPIYHVLYVDVANKQIGGEVEEGEDVDMNGEEEVEEEEEEEEEQINMNDDIRNFKGIGVKSEKILKKNGINFVKELFDVIENDDELLKKLKRKIRGFTKIVKHVNDLIETMKNDI